MGMYNSFFFNKHQLKSNRENENTEFQSKCGELGLDQYKFDGFGNLTVFDLDGIDRKITVNGEFEVYSFEHNKETKETKEQVYKIIIVNNRIVYHIKLKEEGY